MDPTKIAELATQLGVAEDDKAGLVSFVLGFAQASNAKGGGGGAAAAAPSGPIKIFYWPFQGRGASAMRMLAEAKIPFEHISDFSELAAKCALFGAKSPTLAPPILVDDGRAVSQSLAIAAYVGSKYGFPCQDLAKGLQVALNMVDCIEIELFKAAKNASDLRKFFQGGGGKPARFGSFCSGIEIAIEGPYLFGAKPSWVDFLIASLASFANFILLNNLKEHAGADVWAPFPKLSGIVEQLNSLESFKQLPPIAGPSFVKGPDDPLLVNFNSPQITILGASGYVGTSLAAALSGRATVHAGVRNPDPEAPKNAGLKKAGVEFVAADMGKPETLEAAITSGSTVMIVTPGAENRTELGLNAIRAAVKAGAGHIGLVSVASAGSTGLFATQFRPLEAELASSGVSFSIYRLPLFLDNVAIQPIKDESAIRLPVPGDQPVTHACVKDIGEAIAGGLLDQHKFGNRVLNVAGIRVTHNELAAAFGKALDKEVKFEEVAEDKHPFGMFPGWQVTGILELYKLIKTNDIALICPDGDNHTAELLGRAPTTVEAFAEGMKGMFA